MPVIAQGFQRRPSIRESINQLKFPYRQINFKFSGLGVRFCCGKPRALKSARAHGGAHHRPVVVGLAASRARQKSAYLAKGMAEKARPRYIIS